MLAGDESILHSRSDGLLELFLLALSWPAILVLFIVVMLCKYISDAFMFCYAWPTKRMARFWEQRRKNQAVKQDV